jgi:hypothetical protein
VCELVRDPGGADRPGSMAAIDAAEECERSTAVVIDDGRSFSAGEGVMCALEREASCT